MSIARNTAYNLIGTAVPLAMSLVTVPFYLKSIGLDRFGVLSICLLLTGYFNLFDFGLGRAAAQKIATLAEATSEERSRIFWTAAALSAALAALATAAFAPIAGPALGTMNLPNAGLGQEIRDALPLLVAAVPFGIAQSLLVGALEGRSEFLKINLIVSAGTIATAVLPLAASLLIGPEIAYLLIALLGSRLLVLVLLILACARAVPLRRPRMASQRELGQLLRFGGWTTITNVIGPLLVYFDRFLIGAVLSSSAVALYVVPFNLINQSTVLPAALASALFPRLAASSPQQSAALSRQAMLVLASMVTPLTLAIAICVAPFLDLWLGPAIGQASAPVAYLLLFGVWANSLARIPAARLRAEGKPRLIAITHLAEVIPYLALLYFAMTRFGILGAALAWSVRCAVDSLILSWLGRIEGHVLRILSLYGAIVGAASLTMLLTAPWSLGRLVLLGLLALLLSIVLICHTPRQFIDRYLAPIRRRIIGKKALR